MNSQDWAQRWADLPAPRRERIRATLTRGDTPRAADAELALGYARRWQQRRLRRFIQAWVAAVGLVLVAVAIPYFAVGAPPPGEAQSTFLRFIVIPAVAIAVLGASAYCCALVLVGRRMQTAITEIAARRGGRGTRGVRKP